MINTTSLDKEKTIRYLKRVIAQHDRQLSPIESFWMVEEITPEFIDEMGHGFKKQFAETMLAKIQLGDLDE